MYAPMFTFPIATCRGRKCLIIAIYSDPKGVKKNDGVLVADFETGFLSREHFVDVQLDTARIMNIKGDPL